MKPDGVIFDCDGVLVDSETVAFDQMEADLAIHGPHLTRAQMEGERRVGEAEAGSLAE